MNRANNFDSNAKWITSQLHTIEDGEICYIWHEHSTRVRDIDNEIKLRGMQVDKHIGQHYTIYKRRK